MKETITFIICLIIQSELHFYKKLHKGEIKIVKLFTIMFIFIELFWYTVWYGQTLNDGKDIAGLLACICFKGFKLYDTKR